MHTLLLTIKTFPILRVAGRAVQRKVNEMVQSPFPPHTSFLDWAKQQKIAQPNITNADQRFRWGVQVFLQVTSTQ